MFIYSCMSEVSCGSILVEFLVRFTDFDAVFAFLDWQTFGKLTERLWHLIHSYFARRLSHYHDWLLIALF